MGWLRNLREGMGFGSDRKLAERLLKHPDRPSELKLENLANNLGKLDRGDVGWWQGVGEPWTPLLAEELNMGLDELRAQIHRLTHPASAEGTSPDRYWTFPWLRALDLATEPLPPGIPWPADFFDQGDPSRVWWTAGPGAGKTLLGRWLQVQRDWTYVATRTWREALERVPKSGRIYIELEVPTSEPALASDLPEETEVWVAAPFPPTRPTPSDPRTGGQGKEERAGSEGAAESTPTWKEVHTPSVRDWSLPLLEWLAPRVTPGGRFDLAEASTLLKGRRWKAMFETPGDMIDFLGLVDEVGAKTFLESEGLDAEAVLRPWLRLALDRPDRTLSPTNKALLKQDGVRLLVELVQERLRKGLAPEMPLDDWMSLVPRRRTPPIDRDALIQLIEQGTPEAKAAAKAMLKPSRQDVITALQDVKLLVRGPDDRWALRPSWLANFAQDVAVRALCDEGPDGLGALLLYTQTTPQALTELLGQVAGGALDLLSACVTDVDGQSPERLAALDGAFRVLGHRLLLGDRLPDTLLSQAWHTQMAYAVERYLSFPPIPIVMSSHVSDAPLTHLDAWLRAAMAISLWVLDAGQDLTGSPLCPWHGLPDEARGRESYLQNLSRALTAHGTNRRDDTQARELAQACARLARLALDRLPGAGDNRAVQQGAALTLLVRMARDGKPAPTQGPVRDALELPGGLTELEDVCHCEGTSVEHVLRWLWLAWSPNARPYPPFRWTSLDQANPALRKQAERLWRSLPVEVIQDDLLRELAHRPVVWSWLPETFWPALVQRQATSAHARIWSDNMWDHVPLTLLLDTLRGATLGAFHLPAYRVGWTRAPDAVLALIDEAAAQPPRFIQEGHSFVRELLHSGIAVCPQALIDRAETWRSRPDDFPGVGQGLERWLMDAVERRVPGWRRAFQLLIADRSTSPGAGDHPPTQRSPA